MLVCTTASLAIVSLSLLSLVGATKTLAQVRDELTVFENAIIDMISIRTSLGKFNKQEESLIYSILGVEHSFSTPPPNKVFYGNDSHAPPYIFYSSDKEDCFGKPKKNTSSGIDNVFDFVTSQLRSLNGSSSSSSSSTLLSRASTTASILSLTSERIALGFDVAKAKLASSIALQQANSPTIIRQILTNRTQEKVVRASVEKKSAALGLTLDTIGLFDILIDATTDVEVATVLNTQSS